MLTPTAAASTVLDVVDRHIKRMIAARPFEFVGRAMKDRFARQGLGKVDDVAGLQARQAVLERFGLERMARGFLDVCTQVAGQ